MALGAEQLPGGTWSLTKTITGTTSGTITHLKATLESMCDVNMEYWCWTPPETYTTGRVPVSDHVYKGQNVAAAAVALHPVLTRNPTFFCQRFLLRAGTHRLRSTLTDQYIACELAVGAAEYSVVRVLESIIDTPGSAVLEDLLPEAFPAPDPAMVPPIREDWEDETGCNQDIPAPSIDPRETHVEDRHGYSAPPGLKASKWEHGVPWKLLVRPHALNYKAVEQVDYPGRCQRVIRYITYVGYEWVFATEEFRITDEYTVITNKDTGDFITAFPGRPPGQQT